MGVVPRVHGRTVEKQDMDDERRRQRSSGMEYGCYKTHLHAPEPSDKRKARVCGVVSSLGRGLAPPGKVLGSGRAE